MCFSDQAEHQAFMGEGGKGLEASLHPTSRKEFPIFRLFWSRSVINGKVFVLKLAKVFKLHFIFQIHISKLIGPSLIWASERCWKFLKY